MEHGGSRRPLVLRVSPCPSTPVFEPPIPSTPPPQARAALPAHVVVAALEQPLEALEALAHVLVGVVDGVAHVGQLLAGRARADVALAERGVDRQRRLEREQVGVALDEVGLLRDYGVLDVYRQGGWLLSRAW